MSKKLELHWIGKDKEILVEPRILIENKELSNIENDENTENMLIHGDNLLALKALEQKYTGKVKCIYIDPPYNTKSAFEHYNDNLEHSTWLSLMKSRLEILRKLLRDDGGIFVQIDDNEQAYLKVLMDEIFGRDKFLNTISVKMSEASGIKMTHASKRLPKIKEYILVYKKEDLVLNEVKIPKKTWDNEYKTIITNITKEEISFIKSVCKNEKRSENEIKKVDELLDKAKYSSLSEVYKKENIQEKDKLKFNFDNAYRIFRTTSVSEKATLQLVKLKKLKYTNVFFSQITPQNKMYIIKGDFDENKKKPRTQVIFSDDYLEYNPGDFWTDIKTTGLDNEGAGVEFKNSKKPEALISRILEMITNENDLVLDSFLGSGTTAAVAHKMNRKYIGIEMGEHAYTHCKVRLDRVINGEDSGGITKSVNWQGGGGYHFYELAPSLLVENDKLPIYQINPSYTFEMLCEAICKIEGFRYKPQDVFHGHSSEKRFIHITTEFINAGYIKSLSARLTEGQSLLIYGTKVQSDMVLPDNIAVKKIPKDLLEKCDFESEVQ